MPLKLFRRPGSDCWYIRGSVRGQAVRESTSTDDKALAEAIRIKRENELLQRSVFGVGATVTFLEAAVSYLEAGGEKRMVPPLVAHFGTTPLAKIDQDAVDSAARILFPNAGPATRKRHLYGPMSAILNHAGKRGWIVVTKIEHPKVATTNPRWSSPERLEKLLPHCAPSLRRLVVLLTYTGLRLSEALRIDWDHIDLSGRTIIVPRTKNGRLRAVHIPDPLLIELAAVTERDGLLFHWSHKSHVHKPLRAACKRAGVEYLPPHQQGRHTYATWLRTYAGLDLAALKEAGGWESIQSVVRYAHVSPGEAARAADRLPGLKSAQNPPSLGDDTAKPLQTKAK